MLASMASILSARVIQMPFQIPPEQMEQTVSQVDCGGSSLLPVTEFVMGHRGSGYFWVKEHIFSERKSWREIPEQLKLWLLRITGSKTVSVILLTFFSPIAPSQRKDKLREHMQRMHNPEREAKKADRISRSKTFKPRIASTDYESFMFKCRLCMMGFRRRGMLVSAWVLLQPLYAILMNR